jgi:transcriptional regulator with XRE-family HTH domain
MKLTELRKLREARGLTRLQLAERSGVGLPIIQKIEQGLVADTSLGKALKLASVLEVPVTALVSEDALTAMGVRTAA